MRLLRKRLFAAGFVATTAVLGAPGCAENESSLFVRAVLVVEPPECVVKSDPGSAFLLQGVMDVGLTQSYRAALLVGNQLVRRGSRDQLRTETSRIRLQGAEVHLTDSEGSQLFAFSIDGSGFVDPGSGDEPGFGVMSTVLIPPEFSPRAGTTVTARVRVYGRTLGGTDIESGDFWFPIYVCRGCLVSYPLEADDPAQDGYQCIAAAAGGEGSGPSEDDIPCRIGQDDYLDCRWCAASLSICQTPGGT